jgi:hypothetical protein
MATNSQRCLGCKGEIVSRASREVGHVYHYALGNQLSVSRGLEIEKFKLNVYSHLTPTRSEEAGLLDD